MFRFGSILARRFVHPAVELVDRVSEQPGSPGFGDRSLCQGAKARALESHGLLTAGYHPWLPVRSEACRHHTVASSRSCRPTAHKIRHHGIACVEGSTRCRYRVGERGFDPESGAQPVSNARQILAMLRCRAAGDDEQFFTIALQVAAAEARQGHRTLAEGIREAVEKARAHTGAGQTVAVPFAAPRGDLADLIELRSPAPRLDDVVLNDQPRRQIDDLIREQTRRDWIREHGKTPSRRILFVGPPGSGKTMTAEALAAALKLPLFVIRLEALITRFMGETAAKLRLVFDETAKRRGVYLFDEFDAVGGHRSASNDVAEMRRVLNSFLQFMEEANATDSFGRRRNQSSRSPRSCSPPALRPRPAIPHADRRANTPNRQVLPSALEASQTCLEADRRGGP